MATQDIERVAEERSQRQQQGAATAKPRQKEELHQKKNATLHKKTTPQIQRQKKTSETEDSAPEVVTTARTGRSVSGLRSCGSRLLGASWDWGRGMEVGIRVDVAATTPHHTTRARCHACRTS
ncbi:uncharacterized protein LOC143277810 [Babylonia areolata]|uniref:uncharacterized protein LOC143277810 n=1 Tax=Babylonia areolata TaxID=304850 RepID=UPI003FD27A21